MGKGQFFGAHRAHKMLILLNFAQKGLSCNPPRLGHSEEYSPMLGGRLGGRLGGGLGGGLRGGLGGGLGGGIQRGLQTGLGRGLAIKLRSGLVQVWFSIGSNLILLSLTLK